MYLLQYQYNRHVAAALKIDVLLAESRGLIYKSIMAAAGDLLLCNRHDW